MAAKLSDSELARRVRERSQQRSIRYRERLSRSGRTQTLVWLPDALRAQLDATAAQRNQNLSEVTTALLSAALQSAAIPAPARSSSVDSRPLFDAVNPAPADRNQRILELKRQGLSNYAIGDQLGCSEAAVRRALKRVNLLEGTP